MIEEIKKLIEDAKNEPTEAEKELAKLTDSIKLRLIDVTMEYEEGTPLLSIGGGECFRTGNFGIITGKAKAGKSTAISIMIAAFLVGEIWDGYVKCLNAVNKVIYLDSDQNMSDSQLLNKRILQVAGLPMENKWDKLMVLNLRTMSKKERLDTLEHIAELYPESLIIIDNIADYLCSFNDETESTELMDNLRSWSSKYNSYILAVIHENPMDNKPRGHLGTQLENYCSERWAVKKNGNIHTLTNCTARHKECPELSYAFDADGNVIPADELLAQRVAEKKAKQDKAHMAKLQEIEAKANDYLLSVEGQKAIQADIVRYLEEEGCGKRSAVSALLKELRELDMLHYDGKYFYIANDNSPEPSDDVNT